MVGDPKLQKPMFAELWTDQLQECDSDDDTESIEVAEQKCAFCCPALWCSAFAHLSNAARNRAFNHAD